MNCDSMKIRTVSYIFVDFIFLFSWRKHLIFPDADLISIDKTTGHIEVEPINRDALNQEIFPFYVGTFWIWQPLSL